MLTRQKPRAVPRSTKLKSSAKFISCFVVWLMVYLFHGYSLLLITVLIIHILLCQDHFIVLHPRIHLLKRWRRRELPEQNNGEEDTECVRHKERLLHISQRLSQQNLQDLLFLVHDIILPNIDSCAELFQELQQKGHVGVNNYSKLRQWLVEIGRMDLARELPGTPTHKDQLSIAVDKGQQSHRFLMFQVSEWMHTKDVQKLVYLCPAIPQSRCKTITEGFQLFQELEQRGLISSDNYGYVSERLRCIGRVDLAWKLTLHQHNMPSSLHSFRQVEQMFSFFCNHKRQPYQLLLKELDTATTDEAWMKRTEEIMTIITATWNRKAMLHGRTASTAISEVIQTTLELVIAFIISEAEVISAVMKGDTRKLRRSSEKCHKLYREFSQALERIGWNPPESTREYIQQLCSGRKAPHGKAADGASRKIQTFCKEFLGEEGMEVEFQSVNENIHKIESTYYHLWQTLSMMEWMSDLIRLGQTSAVDLHRHMATLTQLLSQHEHIITQAMPTISHIVGKEITDITTPLLSQATLKSHADNTPLQIGSGDIVITVYTDWWAILLLELIAVASGYCTFDHKKVGEAYTRNKFEDPQHCLRVVTAGMEYARSITGLLYAQLAECKESAVRAASHGPQGCSDVIKELFQ